MKKTYLFTGAILFFVPVAFSLTGTQPTTNAPPAAVWLWLITRTGGMPYALITAVLLGIGLWYSGGKRYRYRFVAVLILSAGVAQISLPIAKACFAEPRPFISTVYAHNPEAIARFYRHSRAQRTEILTAQYRHNRQLPAFLKAYRAAETGYAFPSGHTLFAASWALLYAAFTARKYRRTAALISLWAISVMSSRIWLGMHYPHDLAAAVVWAFILNTLLLGVLCREALTDDFKTG